MSVNTIKNKFDWQPNNEFFCYGPAEVHFSRITEYYVNNRPHFIDGVLMGQIFGCVIELEPQCEVSLAVSDTFTEDAERLLMFQQAVRAWRKKQFEWQLQSGKSVTIVAGNNHQLCITPDNNKATTHDYTFELISKGRNKRRISHIQWTENENWFFVDENNHRVKLYKYVISDILWVQRLLKEYLPFEKIDEPTSWADRFVGEILPLTVVLLGINGWFSLFEQPAWLDELSIVCGIILALWVMRIYIIAPLLTHLNVDLSRKMSQRKIALLKSVRDKVAEHDKK